MANIKYIATTSDKLKQIPFQAGQIIFSRDDRVIYLDSDKRTAFRQISFLDYESERKKLVSPINQSFYFVELFLIIYLQQEKIMFFMLKEQNY